MALTDTAEWQALLAHARGLQGQKIVDWFGADAQRFSRLSCRWQDWLVDYSKQRLQPETLPLLFDLLNKSDFDGWRQRMAAGETINDSEKRAALHIALRQPKGRKQLAQGREVNDDVWAVRDKMSRFVEQIHQGTWRGADGGKITDIVNIGIGGSDLGPRMVSQALSACAQSAVRVHYVANLDAADLMTTLDRLNPLTTLFIIASKTFTTQETMQNARTARAWFTSKLGAQGEAAVAKHFVALSTNLAAVAEFGIDPKNAFEFWDWVGGRFSLWSAIGLPVALDIGNANFDALLQGAHAMDEHFFHAPIAENVPALMALIEIWNSNFLGASTRALLPYSQSLALLPRFIQQLEMESNGKCVDRQGRDTDYSTAPIVWGEAGTNGQHAFYQLIHQGGRLIPCEFIALAQADYDAAGHHSKLLANCFAQSAALMQGKTLAEARAELKNLPSEQAEALAPYRVFAGNQPSTTVVLPKLSPYHLGALLALYEHKVFTESMVWRINPFDQWGVEYGKQLASRLLPVIEQVMIQRANATEGSGVIDSATVGGLDGSTAGLVSAVAGMK